MIFLGNLPKQGAGFPIFWWNFGDDFLVLKTSRAAMKHITNEGGGHIWSLFDAIIPKR